MQDVPAEMARARLTHNNDIDQRQWDMKISIQKITLENIGYIYLCTITITIQIKCWLNENMQILCGCISSKAGELINFA